MYGVPTDLPLEPFVGREFNQICLGQFQVQLHSTAAGSISLEGRWELRSTTGLVEDSAQDHSERDTFRIHKVLEVPVTRFHLDPPHSFTLEFENGYSLTVFDDSKFESFSVSVHGQPTRYI